jgi:hypothetical protein
MIEIHLPYALIALQLDVYTARLRVMEHVRAHGPGGDFSPDANGEGADFSTPAKRVRSHFGRQSRRAACKGSMAGAQLVGRSWRQPHHRCQTARHHDYADST